MEDILAEMKDLLERGTKDPMDPFTMTRYQLEWMVERIDELEALNKQK
jgi:hypothetical protein